MRKLGDSRRGLVLALTLTLAGLSGPASGQLLEFPSPPTSGIEAETNFHTRARVVIHFNACAREFEHLNYRLAQSKGDYEKDGEELGSILIGKLGWLRDAATSERTCTFKRVYERQPDEAVDAFKDKVLGGWNAMRDCATAQIDQRDSWVEARFSVTPGCMRRQVNEAILAMRKRSRMGTDQLPCLDPSPLFRPYLYKGDFDVNVRQLVRILFMGQHQQPEILQPETIQHMWKELLAARGPLGDGTYSLVTDCETPAGDALGTPEDYADGQNWEDDVADFLRAPFKWLEDFLKRLVVGSLATGAWFGGYPYLLVSGEEASIPLYDLRVPETENHRLMIETSRYLINQAMIAHLVFVNHPDVDDVKAHQGAIREYLLKLLQDIFSNDFAEYNSRPYTRYSIEAILNLWEYSTDPALRDAAKMVLDLSAAKFAATSNQGRRVVPFRRLSGNDGFGSEKANWFLYNAISGADHEVVRAIVFYGQLHLPGPILNPDSAGVMVNTAVSRYRPPTAVWQVAVERPLPFAEVGKYERVYSTPTFTMSVGGRKTDAALHMYEQTRPEDRGVAMPTVIMPRHYPIGRGTTFSDLFYFDGGGAGHDRYSNTCGYKGFICGFALHMSQAFQPCTVERPVSPGMPAFFVNSRACDFMPPNAFHFYAVGFHNLFEIMGTGEADARGLNHFDAFIADRLAAIHEPDPPNLAMGTFHHRMATGERVHYGVPFGEGDDHYRIFGINSSPASTMEFTDPTDDIIRIQHSPLRLATIRCPWTGAQVVYDFTDWNQPKLVP